VTRDVVVTPLRTEGKGPRVLTIDAEDWFHVCGHREYSDPARWDGYMPRIETTLGRLFDTLAAGRHRATVFFLGWIARRYRDLPREAARRGHEIGVHGDIHRRADELTPEEFREDVLRARDAIEAASGVRASVHRAAEWSIRHPGAAALPVLAGAGFRCDASMMPVPPLGLRSNLPGPHRIGGDGWSLVEIPPLTGTVLGLRLPFGGAWPFRVLPERRLAEAERAVRERGEPAVFNVHPWEVDPEHPAMPGLSPVQRTVHFLGLRRLPGRLHRFLDGERCVALEDALAGLMQAQAPA
jgi:polysaccharide deacetylase family protein (PEP-CTERM system associated)